MGKTCIMKIMERAAGRSVQVGDRVWCKVDLASARDFGGANCVLQFEQEMGRDAKVWDPDKVALRLTFRPPLTLKKYRTTKRSSESLQSVRAFLTCLISITASASMSCWRPVWSSPAM